MRNVGLPHTVVFVGLPRAVAFVLLLAQTIVLGWSLALLIGAAHDAIRARADREKAAAALVEAQALQDQARALLTRIEVRARSLRARETSDAAQVSCL